MKYYLFTENRKEVMSYDGRTGISEYRDKEYIQGFTSEDILPEGAIEVSFQDFFKNNNKYDRWTIGFWVMKNPSLVKGMYKVCNYTERDDRPVFYKSMSRHTVKGIFPADKYINMGRQIPNYDDDDIFASELEARKYLNNL